MTDIIEQVEEFAENKILEPIEGFFTAESPVLQDWLKAAGDLLERNGGQIFLQLAKQIVPDIATGKWGDLTAKLIADARASGIALVAEEEQLAASTALQIAQAAGTALNVNTATSSQ